MTTLTDQTVLITGANRGLGREFVEQFLTRGVAKVYAAARNPESITTDDPRVVPLQLDVTDPDSVARAAATAHDVSIVVNNAGVSTPTPVLSGDTANLRRELEVNLFGPLAVTTAFADRLADRRGAVVNVASVLSWLGIGGSYSVSKAALWSATDSMRLDLTPRGVQVVGVYMAYVDTDMATGVDAPKTLWGSITWLRGLTSTPGCRSVGGRGRAAVTRWHCRRPRRRALRGQQEDPRSRRGRAGRRGRRR
jgi:NAD(P)-dependent dehydrogenase (short-subunit alcohol dehydrogenase family)